MWVCARLLADADSVEKGIYDHSNRLIERMIAGDTKHFRYDKLGNLTGRDLDSAISPDNQFYTRAHQLTALRTSPPGYGYDADGNMTQRGSQRLQYGPRNELTCVGTEV